MLEDTDFNMNLLLSNIVCKNRYSHCRLCLKEIDKFYLRFEDVVCSNKTDNNFQTFQEVVNELLQDDKMTETFPGVDAVCIDCVNQVLDSIKFINKCKKSTELLNKVIDNVLEALEFDLDDKETNKSMFLTINGADSRCVLVLRENDQKTKSHYEVVPKKVKKRDKFYCLQCDDIYTLVTDLKAHNATCHNTFTCDTCCETFTTESQLDAHVIDEHRYQCSVCHITKSSMEDLKKHQDRIHNDYMCKHCGKSCKGLEKLHKHEMKHTTKNECPKCGKSYSTKEFFLKHVKLCLENRIDPHPMRGNIEKSFFCDPCGKGYSTEGGLRVHMRFVHGNAKPHVCSYCGKKFTAPSYLKTHMIKHSGEKNFRCDICRNRFVSKEALLYHTRRHTGEKPYSCNICNERFVNASARAEHIKFRHVGPTLMCEICSRKFVTSHFLKQHMSRHHDPASKLYIGRSMIPPNMPGEQNMRVVKTERDS